MTRRVSLRGLSRRFPRANPLVSGAAVLRDHYAALEADSRASFPALAEYARSLATAGRE